MKKLQLEAAREQQQFDIRTLAKNLGGQPVLRDQRLVGFEFVTPDFNDAQLAKLGTALAPIADDITDLHFNSTKIGDPGLSHISQLKNLQSLRVANTRVTTHGLTHLARMKNLKVLVLTSTEIGNDGVAHLRSLVSIETLYLGGTKITSAMLGDLVGLTNLKELEFDGDQFNQEAVGHLKQLPRLESLNLIDLKYTSDTLGRLKQLPSRSHPLPLSRTTRRRTRHRHTADIRLAMPAGVRSAGPDHATVSRRERIHNFCASTAQKTIVLIGQHCYPFLSR